MRRNWSELKGRLSRESQARVNERVRRTLAGMPLAEIRRAVGLTQVEMARTLRQSQGSVSKIENEADMYLSTLRKYIEAMGGTLRLTATFARGRKFEIGQVADLGGDRPDGRSRPT